MDEELEEVVQLVREGIDGAGLGLRDVILEGQRLVRFVARREGYVLQIAVVVGDLKKMHR
jgi:hypothetical protein